MSPKTRNRVCAVAMALVAICMSAVPASNQSDTPRLYNLYEDNYGSPWCGGGCDGGWCCRITPVYVQSVGPDDAEAL
jgi:hypothetical protein